MADAGRSLEYLGAHLKEALATDPRVAEQGVHVDVVADSLVVSGTVSTPDRHAAIPEIARETVPGVTVRNHVRVVQLFESDDEEPVP
jgi:osmotically-inducible protein OsmY